MIQTGYPNWCWSWLQQDIPIGVCHGYNKISQMVFVMDIT